MNIKAAFREIFIFIPLFLSINGLSFSQERKDIGVQAGGAYYIGDYNVGKPLFQPSPGIGIIYRYNTSKYLSLRAAAYYGSIKGSHSPSVQYLPGITGSFSKQLIEADGVFEINFMSFNTKHLNKDNFAPYVIVGVGMAYIGGEIIPHFPFGVGVKFCPASRLTIGAEWKMSKTFNDNIDNYQGVFDGSKPILHNNDWFSFVGLFITYRLYNSDSTCPAYKKKNVAN